MTDTPPPGPGLPGPQPPGASGPQPPGPPGPQPPGLQPSGPSGHGPFPPYASAPPGPPAPAYQGGYPVWPANVPAMLPPLPAPPGAYPVSVAYEPVAGTPYGVVYPQVRPVTSGAAIGSLAAGIASIVVSLSMSCLGLIGAGRGWGTVAAGAFAILAALFALAAIWVGTVTLRAIRRPTWPYGPGIVGPGMMPTGAMRYGAPGGAAVAGGGGPGGTVAAGGGGPGGTVAAGGGGLGGAGMAVAGRICGWIGFGLTVLGFLGVLLAQASA